MFYLFEYIDKYLQIVRRFYVFSIFMFGKSVYVKHTFLWILILIFSHYSAFTLFSCNTFVTVIQLCTDVHNRHLTFQPIIKC